MANPIADFDHWLITDKFEPMAWRFQHRFGKDNFFIARVMYWLSFLSMVLPLIIATVLFISMGILPAWLLLDPVLILWMAAFFDYRMNLVAKQVRREPQKLNPLKGLWLMRVFSLPATMYFFLWKEAPTLWYGVLMILLTITLISWVYFVACNPMPPGWKPKEKVRAMQLAPSKQ